MNRLLSILLFMCLAFSFNKGFAQTKPQLTYTVVAYIEEQTANYFGGKLAVQDSITKQFQRVSAIFNTNTSFANTYNFTAVAFKYFKDNANEDSTFAIHNKPAETNYNYRIVYNAFPNSNYEYSISFFDQTQSVVFSYLESRSINGSTFGRIMTKTIAHEFGHSRGAYDLYAGNINGNQNLVNTNLGWSNPVNSIMNGLFTENSFDTYSTYMINKTASLYGNHNFTPDQWRSATIAAFPQTIGVSVAAGNGFPIPNATVKFYAIPWFPASDFTIVAANPTYTLTTDNGGLAKFTGSAANPFGTGAGWVQYHTLFVTVTYNTETKYAWIPFNEVCSAFAAGQTAYYKNVFVNAINYNIPPMINVGTSGPLIGNAPLSTAFPIYAYDLDGSVSSVKVYNNGVFAGNAVLDNTNKVYWYTTPSALAAGHYSFTATVTDNLGAAVTSAALKVDVNPANINPSVNLLTPANNAVYTAPASITISGNASDSDGTISKIQLYESGNLLATYTTASFSYVWSNVAKGDYTISARVTDNKGGVSIATVSAKVNPANICTAPTWNSATAYVAGNQVVYAGIKYQANWWTLNERPDLNNGGPGSGKPWTSLGTCTSRSGQINESKTMEVYPNPAQGIISINFESTDGGDVEISVSDMMSQALITKELNATGGTNTLNLDVSSLPTGIYILSISNGSDKLVKQLVISK